MPDPLIRPLVESDAPALVHLLVETVASGGSVSFMHPLAKERALSFWKAALASAGRGERVILGALDGEALVGTVTLVLALPENQPHRAEIAKMMTATAHRGRGIARALLIEAERLARAQGRTMLVLDTASEEGAGGLYEKQGFVFCGEIPDFALKPHGGLTGTRLYYKRLPPG
ncbi:GNAT family N-acetyltransferase [Ancylobacter radicis]|uniref:GNAT family N-acetyltransferase n=1 Tax=Ancylobacter radicis TaxID=2836179 RepID=A0ABS5RDX5_9HYPH|nr:GNAT family N-acetyltransferase [Ancylobacter radicis]MBS9478557.1 GNAT family N-acetyltransferase [Ancylobacter radicis]